MMEVYGRQIKQLEDWGLVTMTPHNLEVTYPKGWYYSDNVSKMFYTKDNYGLPQPAVGDTKILQYLVPASPER